MAIEKKINTEAVNDYPPIRFEIRFKRKFPTVGLYFLTLPVETLWSLCPVENLFGMRMAALCQFYWRTCGFFVFTHDASCVVLNIDWTPLDIAIFSVNIFHKYFHVGAYWQIAFCAWAMSFNKWAYRFYRFIMCSSCKASFKLKQ